MLPHEKEAEKKAFKEMPPKKKLQHLLTYYSLPAVLIAAGVLLFSFLIWHFYIRTPNENVFVAAVCDDLFPVQKKDAFCEEIRELLDAKEKNQVVRIDDAYTLSSPQDQIRISALVVAGEYNLIVASPDTFEKMAGVDYFIDLEELLDPQKLKEYAPKLVRAAGEKKADTPLGEDLAGQGEVRSYGISLADSALWKSLGGSVEDPVAGIPLSAFDVENALKVLEELLKQ